MARLPEPGGDNGQWGQILNDYLEVAHNDDGSLKNNSVTVAKLATSTTPTNGQSLTYNGTQLTWETPSASVPTHVHSGADITSGTVGASYLPVASEAGSGVVELATTAEVEAGTDTVRATTPAGVKAAIDTAVAALPPSEVLFVDSLGDIPPGTPVDTLVVVRAV